MGAKMRTTVMGRRSVFLKDAVWSGRDPAPKRAPEKPEEDDEDELPAPAPKVKPRPECGATGRRGSAARNAENRA